MRVDYTNGCDVWSALEAGSALAASLHVEGCACPARSAKAAIVSVGGDAVIVGNVAEPTRYRFG